MSSAHGSGGGTPSGFQLPFLDTVHHLMHSAEGIHYTPKQFSIAITIAIVVFFIFEPQQSIRNFELFFFSIPLWFPILMYKAVYERFGQLQKIKALRDKEYMLLEIRIPREVTKTPQAMETFFTNMHITSGETTAYKRYFQGGMRPVWSFEIVSLGGRVHFYMWIPVGYRRPVESFLYAQYPDVEIIEAEDYTRLVDPSEHGYGMFAAEHGLSDTLSNAFPIKTYVDYKMEPGDKPEETVDPLAQVIEMLASIGPQEQFWIQFIARASRGEKFKGLVNADGDAYSWNDMVKEAVEKIRAATVKKTVRKDPVTGADIESETFPNPSRGQTEAIAAIERKASKPIFDVGIRSIYLAPEDSFQGIMIPAQLSMFKPFSNGGKLGNSIGTLGNRWTAMFTDVPWEDIGGHHKHHLNHMAIDVYRRRAYFNDPYISPWMILSTEELAPLFHVPSSTVTTPSVERIQSSTSAAPSNLPS